MPRYPNIPGRLAPGSYVLRPLGLSEVDARAKTIHVIREVTNAVFFDPVSQEKIYYPAYRYAGGDFFMPWQGWDLEQKLAHHHYQIQRPSFPV